MNGATQPPAGTVMSLTKLTVVVPCYNEEKTLEAIVERVLAADRCGLKMEIVKRTDDVRGFKVLPRRWVVERTFGWLMKFRRLRSDYEQSTAHSRAMSQLAMINIVLRRTH